MKRLWLSIKWWFTGQMNIKDTAMNMKSAKEILDKRDDLYDKYLKADREGQQDLSMKYKAMLDIVDWVIGK